MMNRRIAGSILSHTTTQLSSRMASVPKRFSFQVRFFILAHIFMKEDYYEKSNSKQKAQGAFKKLGAVALITADTTVSMSFEPNPVEGGAVLILSPDHLNIKVAANTEDGSDITVEGCTETRLASDTKTTLHARGTTVILKGKITELDVSGTYENKQTLTALNVQGLTSLQKLYCYHNQLTELNVQGLTSLKVLECYSNQLTELNVQGLTALQKLSSWSNQLPELNVQGLTALQELSCWSNQLPELNVQGLTALQKLYCSENQLTALNVQGLTALQELYCSYNQLTELNVQGRASLKELDCYSNQLNAQAMTELLQGLMARTAGDDAEATLYTEKIGVTEGNCKDYTQPAELKTAFDGAKSRKWQLMKVDASGNWEDI